MQTCLQEMQLMLEAMHCNVKLNMAILAQATNIIE